MCSSNNYCVPYVLCRYKWLCIEDDDGYINIPNYVKMLRSYDHREDWYIGKPSLPYKFPKGVKRCNTSVSVLL